MKIQHKFIAFSLLVTIFSMCLVVIVVYKQVKSEEEIKAFDTCYKTLASVESSRIYVREKLRPIFSKFNGENIFVPEIMSASFVAREQFEIFLKKYPEYYVKFASINPRNPFNQADKIELQIIEKFKQNPTLKEWQGIVERNNIKYFTVAKPLRFKKNCLRCHGIQKDAPSSLISRYGNTAGFDVSMSDVTIYSIGVPTNVTFAIIWEKHCYTLSRLFFSLFSCKYVPLSFSKD